MVLPYPPNVLPFTFTLIQCREAAACELLSDYGQADRQYKHAFNLLTALLTNEIDSADRSVLQQCMRVLRVTRACITK